MIIFRQPPPAVAAALQAGESTGQFLFACHSTLSTDGRFDGAWLAVTDRGVFVIGERDASIERHLPLGEIRSAAVIAAGSGGFLNLELSDGKKERLLRFATGDMRYFGKAATALNAVASGNLTLPEESDLRTLGVCPTCGGPLLEGAGICPRCFRGSRVLKRLLASTRAHRGSLLLITLLSAISTSIALIPTYLTRILVDSVFTQRHFQLLTKLVAILAVIQVVNMGVGIWTARLRIYLANRLAYEGRNQLLQALQKLPLSFFEKHQTGVITSRVIKDSDAVFDFWVEQSDTIITNFLLLVLVAAMLFYMNWKLALLVLAPSPIILATSIGIRRRLEWRWGRLWDKWNNLYGVIGDSLAGIRVIKAFAQETRQTRQLQRYSRDVYVADIDTHGIFNTYIPFLQFLIASGGILVWFVGGHLVEEHQATLGVLIAFLGYMGMFYAPIRQVSRLADSLPRTLTAIERVFDLLDSAPESYDPPDAVPMENPRGEVALDHVSFGYEPHHLVLKDINLHVRAGENIGLVGHSGAGKSTLVKLLGRFYTVTDGRILIDGVDIRRIPLKDLRAHIGYVEQDPYLFSGTIAANISFSRPEATREEIVAAAMAANAHEFIVRMPDGYDTQVGERGQRLSGGERQRLSIARAILHNPRILILDEPTSAVDLQTERKIQDALRRLSEGRTTFAIAHRLSTLRDCDRLVVLDHGRQVEVGSHDELVDRGGVYSNLVRIHSDVSRLVAIAE